MLKHNSVCSADDAESGRANQIQVLISPQEQGCPLSEKTDSLAGEVTSPKRQSSMRGEKLKVEILDKTDGSHRNQGISTK